MGLLDLSLLALYGAALLFAVIELGLSADIVDVTSYGYYGTNERYSFALFCSVWTILVAGFLLVFPFVSKRGGNTIQSSHQERWMAPLTIALNGLTMIFWLACFAALADLYNGFSATGLAGAQLAFAVMLW
jgi:Membrane-associating domain